MTGEAEIITEDIRLLERFFNPIRALIKRKNQFVKFLKFIKLKVVGKTEERRKK